MTKLLLLAALAGGGKVPFGKDFDAGLVQAKERGVPVLLYFWCDWSPYCAELDKGALSDDAVVKAAEAFVPVIVDVSNDPGRLRERYHVRFAPTLLWIGADGKALDEHKDTWETERVLRSFRLMARRHGRAFWCESMAQAIDLGKKEKRLVIAFYPPKTEKVDPPEKFLREALGDLAWKFLYVIAPPADGAGYVVLDPFEAKPEEKALARIPMDVKPEDLKSKLVEVLKGRKP